MKTLQKMLRNTGRAEQQRMLDKTSKRTSIFIKKPSGTSQQPKLVDVNDWRMTLDPLQTRLSFGQMSLPRIELGDWDIKVEPVKRHHYESLDLPFSASTLPPMPVGDSSERWNVVSELVGTEFKYLKSLGVLVGFYCLPMKEDYPHLVNHYQHMKLFKNCQALLELSRKLLEKMQSAVQQPLSKQSLATVFAEVHVSVTI